MGHGARSAQQQQLGSWARLRLDPPHSNMGRGGRGGGLWCLSYTSCRHGMCMSPPELLLNCNLRGEVLQDSPGISHSAPPGGHKPSSKWIRFEEASKRWHAFGSQSCVQGRRSRLLASQLPPPTSWLCPGAAARLRRERRELCARACASSLSRSLG